MDKYIHIPYPPINIGVKVVFRNSLSKIYTIIDRQECQSETHIIYLYTIQKGNNIHYAVEGEAIKIKQ